MNSNDSNTQKPLREGMTMGEARDLGTSEGMDGTMRDKYGQPAKDAGGTTMFNDSGSMRPVKD